MAAKKVKEAKSTEDKKPVSKDSDIIFFQSFMEEEAKMDISITDKDEAPILDVISTGSYALDDALGANGLPCGRLLQYYGSPGSGKTAMAMLAIREAQQKDPNSRQLFIDAEHTFDEHWAMQFGVDPKRILKLRGDNAIYAQKLFTILLGVPRKDKSGQLAGKTQEGLLDRIRNKQSNINLIVLDSLGVLIPPGEDVSEVGKRNYALMAGFLTTTLKKVVLELSKAQVPMIIINHMKDNMDTFSFIKHKSSGGNSYFHNLSANIFFTPSKKSEDIIFDDEENKIGGLITANIEKSKFGPYPKKAEFVIHFTKGIINKHLELVKLGIKYKVIARPNKLMYKYGEESFKGKDNVETYFEDEDRQKELYQKIIVARLNFSADAPEEEQTEEEEMLDGAMNDLSEQEAE